MRRLLTLVLAVALVGCAGAAEEVTTLAASTSTTAPTTTTSSTTTSTSTTTTSTTVPPTTTTTTTTIPEPSFVSVEEAVPFLWKGGPSPLGVLREETQSGVYSAGYWTWTQSTACVAGIPSQPYQDPATGHWLMPMYFGEHPVTGEPVVATLDFWYQVVAYGGDDSGRAYCDPYFVTPPGHRYQRVDPFVWWVDDLHLDWVYLIEVQTSQVYDEPYDCPNPDDYRCEVDWRRMLVQIQYQGEWVAWLKGERDEPPEMDWSLWSEPRTPTLWPALFEVNRYGG